MSDIIQHELDKLYKSFEEYYPNYCYSQIESRINAYLSSQMSKFRHRKNNPDQYTGIKYDPEGKLKVQKEEESIEEKEVIFFSSQIVAC